VYSRAGQPSPRAQFRAAVAVSLIALVATIQTPCVAIVARAAKIPEQAEGLEAFVAATNALVTPLLVAVAAVTPIGCILGACMLQFGSRRGLVIIGSSLGALVFLGSIKAIVA
jgi:hypothetical protein